jgi:hypothetical protein
MASRLDIVAVSLDLAIAIDNTTVSLPLPLTLIPTWLGQLTACLSLPYFIILGSPLIIAGNNHT